MGLRDTAPLVLLRYDRAAIAGAAYTMRINLYQSLEPMASITSHPETSDKGSQNP